MRNPRNVVPHASCPEGLSGEELASAGKSDGILIQEAPSTTHAA
jgi:hypothetical protein